MLLLRFSTNITWLGDTVEYQDTQLDMTRKAVHEEIPAARRFGERLLKHGLTLERASALALMYVPEDPYKGEPEKAADAFFAAHGHKYR